MSKRFFLVAAGTGLLFVGIASAQHPLLDAMANKVVQKYQQSTCEQLWQQRGKQNSPQERELIQLLRSDPQMRTEFLNRVAAPVANKMFECGLIP